MKIAAFLPLALVSAAPAAAHEVGALHVHNSIWPFVAGLLLIAAAGTAAALRTVKVRA